MKKTIFLFATLLLATLVQAQVSLTVNITTAGTLSTLLTATEQSNTTNLTIAGVIDSLDFVTMRDNMPKLVVIDLSAVTIVGNAIPVNAFHISKWYTGTNLNSIILPSSITLINNGAFWGCVFLKLINIPSSVTSIGVDAFAGCGSLTSVTIPSSVTSIGAEAFNQCSNLTSITIPSSVTSIKEGTFDGCSGLTSINIPSSITQIDTMAFGYCTNLKSIYSYSIVPVYLSALSSPNVFYNVNTSTCVLYVPYGTKSRYKTSYQWDYFTNIVEMPSITFSSTTVNMTDTVGSKSIIYASTVDSWVAKPNQLWLTVNPTTGSGNDTIVFSATQNISDTTRIAVVTFQVSDGSTQTITVNQKAPYFSIPDSIVTADTTYTFISSNTNWKVSSNQSWITVSPDSGVSNSSLKITVALNGSKASRTGSITVTATGVAAQTVTVTQDTPSISITSNTKIIAPFGGSINTVWDTLYSNIAWKASSNQSWLTVTPTSGKSGVSMPEYTATDNLTANRSAIVTFTDATGTITKTVTITQNHDSNPPNLNAIKSNDGIQGQTLEVSISGEDLHFSQATKTSVAVWFKQGTSTVINAYDIQSSNSTSLSAEIEIPSTQALGQYDVYAKNNIDGQLTLVGAFTVESPSKTIDCTAGDLSSLLSTSEASGLTSLTVTGTIDERDIAFLRNNMPQLTSIDLSGATIAAYQIYSADELPAFAFSNNSKLNSIIIPSSVTTIDSLAFRNCSNLHEVTFATPSQLTKIGWGAFEDDYDLNSISIPPTVTSVGSEAFDYCSNLQYVTIYGSVSAIGNNAFQNSSNLVAIKVYTATSGDLGSLSDAFIGVDKSVCLLYVPTGTKSAYEMATGWVDNNVIEYSVTFTVSTNSVSLAATAGNSATVTVTSDVPWSATASEPWLTVTPPWGNAGTTSINISASANTGDTRTASVTVSATGEASQVIIVTQSGVNGSLVAQVNNQTVTLYPNPATTSFSVNVEGEALVAVYNVSGQLVLNAKVVGREPIATNGLPAGLYVVKFVKDNHVIVKQLIVE